MLSQGHTNTISQSETYWWQSKTYYALGQLIELEESRTYHNRKISHCDVPNRALILTRPLIKPRFLMLNNWRFNIDMISDWPRSSSPRPQIAINWLHTAAKIIFRVIRDNKTSDDLELEVWLKHLTFLQIIFQSTKQVFLPCLLMWPGALERTFHVNQ